MFFIYFLYEVIGINFFWIIRLDKLNKEIVMLVCGIKEFMSDV